MNDIEVRCSSCTAFLRIRPKGTFISEVICGNSKCKKVNNVKIVNSDSSIQDIRFKFLSPL